jgi:hypothetical protein
VAAGDLKEGDQVVIDAVAPEAPAASTGGGSPPALRRMF